MKIFMVVIYRGKNSNDSYTAPQYYYWANYDDSSKKISNGTSKNDTISNGGDNVLINCDACDDSLYNGSDGDGRYFGNNVTINSGADDDNIDTTSNTITVTGGTGHDYILIYGCDVKPLEKTVRQRVRTRNSVD